MHKYSLLTRADSPYLNIDVQVLSEASVRLIAAEAAGGLEELLEARIAPGADIRVVFSYAPHLVDGWVEFLLKARLGGDDGFFDHKEGDTYYGLSLFMHNDRWMLAQLEYNTASGEAAVLFGLPKTECIELGVGHVIRDQQRLWLDKIMKHNSNWDIHLDKWCIFLSKSIASLLKLADDAVVISIDRFMQHVHPDEREAILDGIRRCPAIRDRLNVRLLDTEGNVYHFVGYCLAGYTREGRANRIIGQAINITAEEAKKEELAMNKQLFQGIVESSQDLFVVVGRNEAITYVSPNVSVIAGYDPEIVLGASFTNFLSDPEEKAALLREYDKLLSGGVFTESDYQILRADGSIAWFSMRMSTIRDIAGNVAEIVAVCRDITEDKKTQEHLQYVSKHDALTGVYNRSHFERELYRIDNEGITNVGLLLTDLNGLKLINDTYGHERGDDLLIETARILEDVCDKAMSVFRIGGDEFAILSFGTTRESLDVLAAVIVKMCGDVGSDNIPMSLSFGSTFRGDTDMAQSMRKLYMEAEGDMYSNKLLESRSTRSHLITSLKEALRVRNLETADHTSRMEKMVRVIGEDLGLSSSEFGRLMLLASMHDIGKVSIPDAIINKPGALTHEEWNIMRTHSEIGFHLAQTSQELSIIADDIRSHHERWDGAGYPNGQKGTEIPLLARIISVVDAYDVMTNDRVYKKAVPHGTAIEEIKRCSGTQFDPEIVTLFVGAFGDEQVRKQ